jgi:hypothetical protein
MPRTKLQKKDINNRFSAFSEQDDEEALILNHTSSLQAAREEIVAKMNAKVASSQGISQIGHRKNPKEKHSKLVGKKIFKCGGNFYNSKEGSSITERK